ncbi:WG repeat-containing protein [Bacteroides sp. ET336]|uniref:WG repeat-containing protein n=1 Tax=Bacteroides sp. ET336 TaxID=2972459 RepID=UPI0021AC7D37|nr:WG repeat-containing protein [Bacteroides sp. ET336]MCR8894884.1 WG repeat-containing protein [Bacteroides sp. ET336]MDN0059380.1 WG repeat-containing protein [Bacteroides caecigallinarum]
MRKITFKEYFVTLFGGLWQAVLWILGLFGYKDESKFGIVVKRVFALCAAILLALFTVCMLYAFATDIVYRKWIRPHTDDYVWEEKYISNYIVSQQMYYSDKCRVYDKNKGEVLHEDIDWVVVSGDKDSLAVFARNGKRGYINRFTGEIAIPEIYTRAWVFSEGLAAVEKDGELLFIDHSGEIVIDKDFQVYFDNPKYAFKNGYCMIKNPVNGKMGLIDRSGNIVLNTEYDNLFNNEGFWQVEKDGCVGLYDAELKEIFPVENSGICIYDDIIEVRHADHTAKRYDYNGKVIVDFVIDEVSNMRYETTELRNNTEVSGDESFDNKVYGIANCQQYMVRNGNYNNPDYYGLLNRNGKIVTPPIYTSIEAIDRNLYLCQPDGVIINDNGKIVK